MRIFRRSKELRWPAQARCKFSFSLKTQPKSLTTTASTSTERSASLSQRMEHYADASIKMASLVRFPSNPSQSSSKASTLIMNIDTTSGKCIGVNWSASCSSKVWNGRRILSFSSTRLQSILWELWRELRGKIPTKLSSRPRLSWNQRSRHCWMLWRALVVQTSTLILCWLKMKKSTKKSSRLPERRSVSPPRPHKS